MEGWKHEGAGRAEGPVDEGSDLLSHDRNDHAAASAGRQANRVVQTVPSVLGPSNAIDDHADLSPVRNGAHLVQTLNLTVHADPGESGALHLIEHLAR